MLKESGVKGVSVNDMHLYALILVLNSSAKGISNGVIQSLYVMVYTWTGWNLLVISCHVLANSSCVLGFVMYFIWIIALSACLVSYLGYSIFVYF